MQRLHVPSLIGLLVTSLTLLTDVTSASSWNEEPESMEMTYQEPPKKMMIMTMSYGSPASSSGGCQKLGQYLRDESNPCQYMVCDFGTHGKKGLTAKVMPCAPGTSVPDTFGKGYKASGNPCSKIDHKRCPAKKQKKRTKRKYRPMMSMMKPRKKPSRGTWSTKLMMVYTPANTNVPTHAQEVTETEKWTYPEEEEPAQMMDSYDEPEMTSYGPPEMDSYTEPEMMQSYDKPEMMQSYDKPEMMQSYDKPEMMQSYDKPEMMQSYGKPEMMQSYDKPEMMQSYGQPEMMQSYGQPEMMQSYGQPEMPQTQGNSYMQSPMHSNKRPRMMNSYKPRHMMNSNRPPRNTRMKERPSWSDMMQKGHDSFEESYNRVSEQIQNMDFEYPMGRSVYGKRRPGTRSRKRGNSLKQMYVFVPVHTSKRTSETNRAPHPPRSY